MFEHHYQAVCVGCGGPVRANPGQRVSMSAEWQIMPDGSWVHARQNTGRCGDCTDLLDDLERHLATNPKESP